MKSKLIGIRQLWRTLLLLIVCLAAGRDAVQAKIQFNAAPMRITHQPTFTEPYVVAEVLYFDAEGNDSYFTTTAQESGKAGPAVYVKLDKEGATEKWICSPFAELAWNTHQKTAASNIDQDGWWASTNPELPAAQSGQVSTYNNNDVIIRFYNPHRRTDRESGEYYVYMYVFMKEWQVGDAYDITIRGWWKVNEHSATQQEKTLKTDSFESGWYTPGGILTAHNKVSVFGQMNNSLNGDTKVGIYTNSNTAPTGYTTDLTSKTVSKNADSLKIGTGPEATLSYDYDYYTGGTVPVLYSYPYEFSLENWSPLFNYSEKPLVYCWYNAKFYGFVKPKITEAIEVTNQWEKKVKVKWGVIEDAGHSKAGKWLIKNINSGETVEVNNYNSREGEIAIREYSTKDNTIQDKITVYFMPTGYTDNPISKLSASTYAYILPSWRFTEFNAEVIESGNDKGKIRLSWNNSAIGDASNQKPYAIKVLQSTNGKDFSQIENGTVEVKSSKTIDGSYIHSPKESGKTYYYQLKIENLMGSTVLSDVKSAKSGGSQITSFTASRGSYSSMVKLQWTVNKIGESVNFIVKRRPLGSDKENEWADIYTTSGTTTSYSYDDVTALPGSFNEYKLVIWSEETDTTNTTVRTEDHTMKADGFSVSTGIISGNISYGTGTAVEGAKVMLKQQNADGGVVSGMHSLQLTSAGSGVKCMTDSSVIKTLLSGDFSMQMFIKPDKSVMSENDGEYQLFYVKDVFDVKLKYNNSTSSYRLAGSIGDSAITSKYAIPAGEWSHVTLSFEGSSRQLTAYLIKGENAYLDTIANTANSTIWVEGSLADSLVIGNTNLFNSDYWYGGYIDEFRLWTKALTEQEIQRNYNHPMAGNESSLAIYYPFDEGISDQSIAYDFSKKNGVSNGRHAKMKVVAASTDVIPSENQLSLMAYTDVNGYYEIRGVPFSGEGTSYSVIPTLGIHEFSPAAKSRYVSISTLNHSGVDFEDVSAFPVSGTVYYAGTDYPLQGATFYVDGVICSRDGEMIETDENGEFTISVPIGDHFITVKKNGHDFVNGGRYPADPNGVGTKHTFNSEIKNLEFLDETLVNFTGRVVGGDIEGNKAVGFGLSNNNIGVTELILTPLNRIPRMNVVKQVEGTTFSYETNNNPVPIASATERIKSISWRGAGSDDCRNLYIHTDSLTGEFSAMLPPLEYAIVSMNVPSSGDKPGESMTIDLSNPLTEYSDTLHNDDGTDVLYPYNTMLKQVYHSRPTFIVTQEDHEDENTPNDGAFGLKSYEITDGNDKITINDIYSIGQDNNPVYKYGGAIFEMNEAYTFNIEGYEEYVNKDNAVAVTDHVPLSGVVVTINNALSDEQVVYAATTSNIPAEIAGQVVELQSNQLKLDEEGKATYIWIAGLPNITYPYIRTLSITYDIGDRTYPWIEGGGLHGIVLGSLPTGNNFVTSGPDKVDMILRDPPGSGSSASWTKGSVTSKTFAQLATLNSDNHLKTTTRIGTDFINYTGAMGVGVITEAKAKNDLEVGLTAKVEFEGGGTWGEVTETSKAVSTSSDPLYVGADGDVFIGKATNVIFGKCRDLDFRRNVTTNEIELSLDDVIATGVSFGTVFHYTQHYIENELLPNLEMIRNSLLKTVTSESMDNFDMTGKASPVYLTTLTPDDRRFGSNNNDRNAWGNNISDDLSDGPSYKMVVPDPSVCYQDSILWCNSQIQAWKDYLAFNEQEKYEAFENRNKKHDDGGPKEYKNFSFDAGTSITKTTEDQDLHGNKNRVHADIGIHVSNTWGVTINDTGVIIDLGTDTSVGTTFENQEDNSDKVSFSYTLAETGADDALSVDVFKYGKYGPIFRTRGGQTSAPYEGEVKTKYYRPGLTIMEATMQIEKPKIVLLSSSVLSDIPSGSAANYTLELSNQSEVNKNVTYKLFMLDGTNPDGAELSIDGQVLTEGRRINVPGGQSVTKTLQLKQTQIGILNYLGNNDPKKELYLKGIGLVFASESQPEDIADTVFITAKFTPSSSPVSLELSRSIMNTAREDTDLKLTFKDFDRNYHNLKAFRLQVKQQGALDWTQIKEYVLGNPTGNQVPLPLGNSVEHTLPMAAYSDGEYTFRVVSVSTYGDGEVYRYSEEQTLVKDMQRPIPIGLPEPADGILNVGDELSITFNEEIIKGALTKAQNFKVTGVLNGQPVAHYTALSMQNTAITAQTEANINLAGKEFSFDAWINLAANAAGTLLSHGNGNAKMTVGVNSDKQLVVNIAGQTYTSTNAVPTGKWAFLTLSYRNTTSGGLLNATVADDANTTKLFVDQTVVKYEGNGRLVVGKNMTGSIHELLLWDEAHDMTTALQNRTKTKNPSTRHLIGYWKMDEGEGTSIRDYSRNRHMTMTDATWYLNNANKSVVLDGSHYLKIDASSMPLYVDDDYAVEFWMRGDAQADAQLLQMGEISLWVKADGTLQFTGKGAYNDAVAVTMATNATNLTDNAWHHIAVNVLRQGASAVYVDGVRCLTTSSANVGSVNTNNLLLGVRRITESAETGLYSYDRTFTGQIDEVRVWSATMNSDLLIKNRKVRLTGTEDGLVAYYSFETQTLDEGNQIESKGSAKDLTSNLDAELLAVSNQQSADITYSDEAPALRQKPTETNVSFTFVASNEKVVINIDEDPATIEGCTLNFMVEAVQDMNGNNSHAAIWSAFVNRNELVWEENEISIEQEVKEGGEISAYIMNNGGKQQMWTLSGMPAWLTASSEYGTTNPLSESEVTFYVSPATPIGKYEETIYLKGNDGIETPLTLNINVTGQKPDWYVNSKDYMVSMNVIGQVMVQGVPMDDADDLVAAFIGEECRGLVHPVYSARYDGYYVTMNIYGNAEEGNSDTDLPVTFRAYDASTGTLYPEVLAATEIKFEPQTLLGSYSDPEVLTASNKIEQSTELKQGWNWISFYVETDNQSIQTLLGSIVEDVEVIKSQTQFKMNQNGMLMGDLTELANQQMYAIKMKSDRTLRLVGEAVDPDNNEISVGQGWNWIGYYGRQVSSLTDAFAGLDPVNGEILKSQEGVSYYDVYEWSGSLAMMEPGVGYMINVSSARAFSYSASAVQHAPLRSNAGGSADNTGNYMFNAIDFRNYSGNAIMSAKVVMNGAPVAKAELGVFADGECRSVAVTDENGIAYLTIPGDDAVQLSFKVIKGAEVSSAREVITYETDGIYGSPMSPVVLTLDGTTGVSVMTGDAATESAYDLQGRKISDGQSESKGIRIVNGQKQLRK